MRARRKDRPPEITILNLHKHYRLNEMLLRKIILKELSYLKAPPAAALGFVFVDDETMRGLNFKYKKRKAPTDVLSFDLSASPVKPENKLVAEIYISLDTARRNSRIFKTAFSSEIVLYAIHGILHLFGYDDERPRDKKRMSKKESEVLKRLCRREDLSKVLTPR